LLYKSDGNYREVVKSPEFDMCLLESTHFNGFLLEQLAELFKKVIPKEVIQCPLTTVSIWNLTLPTHKIFTILPSGIFKFIIPVRYDDKGPYKFNITGTFQFETIRDKL
jgi:hypothetical protein